VSGNPFLALSRTAISAAAAIVIAAPAMAQNTTAAVGGRVTGADGKPVAGATVTIRHIESGSSSNAVTDADGRYAARGLRVGGPYTITISKGGQTDRRDNVFLTLAESASVDAVLGAPAQTIVVTGQAGGASQTFNSSNMGAGTNVSGRQLQALASIQRNLQDYARTDPRISQTDKERGEISAGGQNSRYNSITIDGVTTNDTFGLESNNLPTAKQPISIDAIQSVQVNLSNYDVTQKDYTGANINAVTKSGTNEFKGSVYYVFRNEGMVGDRLANVSRNRPNDNLNDVAPFKETTKGFTLGGPILKDKLFFFASYEELNSSKAAPDFGPLGSSLTNVGISPAAISSLQDIAANTWGIDIGNSAVPSGTSLSVKDALLKLDWTINDSHRANLRYTKTEQSDPIFSNFGTRALSLSSHWYSQDKTVESVVAQWFADWSPNFSTELKVSHRDYASEPKNASTLPAIAFDFSGTDNLPAGVSTQERTLWAGTERSRHFNQLFTKTLDGYLGATWNLGRHELKFGADLSRNEIFNAFLQDANGQYKFQCDDRYTYSTPLVNAAGAAANCAGATRATIEAAAIENFLLGRATSYQAQLPLAGKTRMDGAADWNLNRLGLFLQDTLAVTPKLNVTVGARIDQTQMPDRPIKNAAAAAPLVAGNPLTNTAQSGGFGLDNSVTLDDTQLVQPRVGFNWNLGTKERRMQLRGGFGLFQGAAANVWLSNPYSNTGVSVGYVGCGLSNELVGGTGNRANCPTTGVFNPDPLNQPSFAGTPPSPSVDFLDPSLRQPAVWKINLALDAELPWFGLVAGAEWLHTKNRESIYYKHLNLGPATATGTDGRQLFYNANGYNTNCWSAAGATTTGAGCAGSVRNRSLANAAFSNVLVATPSAKGGGDALTLSLSQQPTRDFSWVAAYTRTSAKEVSPLTSSVSNSNFNARSIFNPNEEVAANSAYLVRDRVNFAASWSKALFSATHRTTVGLFYEGRRGKPYSWTYNNDLNGDGQAGNDLMYIPSAPGSGEVVFAGGAAEEARFWTYVNRFPELRNAKGKVVSRNGSYAPFTNNFDLRISQEVPGLFGKHKGVISFDIQNLGNLLDDRWGRVEEIGFQSAGGAARSFVNYKGLDANGKYVYSMMTTPEELITRQARGESQWAFQVTLRYEF
jgi:hypothetical protein